MAPPSPPTRGPYNFDASARPAPGELDEPFGDGVDEPGDPNEFTQAPDAPARGNSRGRAASVSWTEEDLNSLANGDVWNMREVPAGAASRRYPLSQLAMRFTVRWDNTVYYVSGGPWDLNSTIRDFARRLGPIVDGQGQYVAELWNRRHDGGLERKLTQKVIHPTQIPVEEYPIRPWDFDSQKLPTDSLAEHLKWRQRNAGRMMRNDDQSDPRSFSPDEPQGYDPQDPNAPQGYDPQDPNAPQDPAAPYQQTQGYPLPPTGFPPNPYAPTGFPPNPYAPTGFPPNPYAPTGFPPNPYAPAGFPPNPYAPAGFPQPFGAMQPYQQPGGLATLPGQPPPGTEGPDGEDVWTPQGWTMSAKRRREREEQERRGREEKEYKDRMERMLAEAMKPKESAVATVVATLAGGIPTIVAALLQNSSSVTEARERDRRDREERERRDRDERERKDREERDRREAAEKERIAADRADKDRREREEKDRRDREDRERREERERREREDKERQDRERADRLAYEAKMLQQANEEKKRLADERDRDAARFAAQQRLELARMQTPQGGDPTVRAMTQQVQELREALKTAVSGGGQKTLLDELKKARELFTVMGIELPTADRAALNRLADTDVNEMASIITAARPTVDKIIDGISIMLATRNDGKADTSKGGFVPAPGGILIGAATAVVGGQTVTIPEGLVCLPDGTFVTPAVYQQRYQQEQTAAALRAQQIAQQQAFNPYGLPQPQTQNPYGLTQPQQAFNPYGLPQPQTQNPYGLPQTMNDPYGIAAPQLSLPNDFGPQPAPYTPPAPQVEPQQYVAPQPAPYTPPAPQVEPQPAPYTPPAPQIAPAHTEPVPQSAPTFASETGRPAAAPQQFELPLPQPAPAEAGFDDAADDDPNDEDGSGTDDDGEEPDDDPAQPVVDPVNPIS